MLPLLGPAGFALLLAATSPAPPHRAAPVAGSLVSLIRAEDYPNAALRNEEQGNVTVALGVDPNGAVTSCTVTASSSSDSLDTTTCRLMIERARFTPAHDRRGRPVRDTFSQTISWRISADSPPSPAVDAYVQCLAAAAQRLAAGPGSDESIADAAYAACPAQEQALLPPVSPQPPETLERLRKGIRPALLGTIRSLRAPR
jgi:TonB family protein